MVAYQQETDGSICVVSKTRKEIIKMTQSLPDDAFAIFDGRCLKTFDAKFDPGRIK